MGMVNILQIDFGKISIKEGEVLLLTTDGIHDFVDDSHIHDLINSGESAQVISEEFVALSKANHSDDNISCALAKVITLPLENRDDFNSKLSRLPFPPAL